MSKTLAIAAALALFQAPALSMDARAPTEQRVVLTFENGESSHARLRLPTRQGVRDYELWLGAEYDTDNTIVGFTVEMHCIRCDRQAFNQLYDNRPLHGIQPFMFLASGQNYFGDERSVPVSSLGIDVSIAAPVFRVCPKRSGEPRFCGGDVPILIRRSAL